MYFCGDVAGSCVRWVEVLSRFGKKTSLLSAHPPPVWNVASKYVTVTHYHYTYKINAITTSSRYSPSR